MNNKPQYTSISSGVARQDTRPGHRGRILKDAGRPDRLSPLTNENTVNSSRNLTVDMKSEHSQRKMRDLEAENEKLKRNLHEAESSIRSYKTFIVARPSRHFVDAEVQTSQASSTESTTSESHRQLEVAHQKLTQQCLNLRNQIDSQSRYISDLKDQHAAALQQKQSELDTANSLIDQLQTASKATPLSDSFTKAAQALRADHTHLASQIKNEVSSYHSYITTQHQQLLDIISQLQQQNILLQGQVSHHRQLSKADSIRLSSKVDSASSPIAPPLRDFTPVKPPQTPIPVPTTPYRTPRTTAPNSPIETVLVTVGTDPMTSLQEYTHQLETIDQLKQQIAAFPALLDKQVNAASSRHQQEKQNLLHAVSSATNNVSSLKSKLSAAVALLLKYQTKVESWVKSVQHEAHCADLVKVACLRESNIERDRLASELKHAKDVQGVLSFSLDSAQQNLTESNPQLLVRLNDSKHRRLAALEREWASRRKDLEQRSVETCVVSTSHLENFAIKSTVKRKKMEEEAAEAIKELIRAMELQG